MNALQSRSTRGLMVLLAALALAPSLAPTEAQAQAPEIPDLDVAGPDGEFDMGSRLMTSGKLPDVPIHIDSPMATDATRIYSRFLNRRTGDCARNVCLRWAWRRRLRSSGQGGPGWSRRRPKSLFPSTNSRSYFRTSKSLSALGGVAWVWFTRCVSRN